MSSAGQVVNAAQGFWPRAWMRFKAQRRAVISLYLFLFCFVLSLGAELISNDKPYVVSYQGALYFPLLKDYPEATKYWRRGKPGQQFGWRRA